MAVVSEYQEAVEPDISWNVRIWRVQAEGPWRFSDTLNYQLVVKFDVAMKFATRTQARTCPRHCDVDDCASSNEQQENDGPEENAVQSGSATLIARHVHDRIARLSVALK